MFHSIVGGRHKQWLCGKETVKLTVKLNFYRSVSKQRIACIACRNNGDSLKSYRSMRLGSTSYRRPTLLHFNLSDRHSTALVTETMNLDVAGGSNSYPRRAFYSGAALRSTRLRVCVCVCVALAVSTAPGG